MPAPIPRCVPPIVLLAMIATGTHGQVLRGTVLRAESARPVAHATVDLSTAAREPVLRSVANELGVFTIAATDTGRYLVTIRRLGYRPIVNQPVELTVHDTLKVVFELSELAVPLDPLVVESRAISSYLESVGFDRRERMGLGYHINFESIAKWRDTARDIADLMPDVPFVQVVESTRVGVGRRLRLNRCQQTRFFVDEVPVVGDTIVPFEHIVDPLDVIAIEIYRGIGAAPVQYGGCSVVIWTHYRVAWNERQEKPRAQSNPKI